LAALGTAACGGAADIPATPDLRSLLESYERPTASIDAARAATALDSVPNLAELAAGFRAAAYVMSKVDVASDDTSQSTGQRVRLQGAIGLALRCPGNAADPQYDENINGSISLTLAVADNRILRSFGGEAKSCILEGTLRGRAARIVLDGALAFDVGRDLGLGQRWTGDLLASLPGTLRVDEFEFRSISGRLTDGRFQYLLTLDDEKTIVLQLGDDGLTVRDNSGVWFCAPGEPCASR